jgi:hypothetical protein
LDAAARPLFEVELDALVLQLERAQVLGQKFDDRRQIGHHPHIASHAARMAGQFDADIFDVAHDAARMMQQRFAGRRERHAARVALEQCGAHGLFELEQALARGGDGNRFALGGTRERAFLIDGKEELQRGEVELS